MIEDGYHRASYLISRGEKTIPVSLRMEDYERLGNSMEFISKTLSGRTKYFLEHPVFAAYNQNSDWTIRDFLFCIQRHGRSVKNHLGIIVAEDGGYLLRNFLRGGSKYINFFTEKKDVAWSRLALKWFAFSDDKYEIKEKKEFCIGNAEFAVLDLLCEDTEEKLKEIIDNLQIKLIYLRISEPRWKKLDVSVRKGAAILERCWSGDAMTISVAIER